MCFAFKTCSDKNSPSFLTSNTRTSLSSIIPLSVSALIEVTVSYSLEAFFQAIKPPSKYPNVLSKPTRDKRVIVSSSRPTGVTNKMDCLTSAIKAPTHGAKLPSKPINIDLGMCPFANSF